MGLAGRQLCLSLGFLKYIMHIKKNKIFCQVSNNFRVKWFSLEIV